MGRGAHAAQRPRQRVYQCGVNVSTGDMSMAWERRRNGRKYYYRSQRAGLRTIKQYVGSGEKGRQAAEADRVVRETRLQSAARRAETLRPIDRIAAQLDQIDKMLDQVVAFRLVCAG